jgi:hypothetical protein
MPDGSCEPPGDNVLANVSVSARAPEKTLGILLKPLLFARTCINIFTRCTFAQQLNELFFHPLGNRNIVRISTDLAQRRYPVRSEPCDFLWWIEVYRAPTWQVFLVSNKFALATALVFLKPTPRRFYNYPFKAVAFDGLGDLGRAMTGNWAGDAACVSLDPVRREGEGLCCGGHLAALERRSDGAQAGD